MSNSKRDAEKKFCIEARDGIDGNLKFDCAQPPVHKSEIEQHFTEDELFRMYFAEHKDAQSASWEELRAWFATKHWYIREVTWR